MNTYLTNEEMVDSPKDLPPPLPCAPPAHSDAQPEMDLNKAVINMNFSSSYLGQNAELVNGRWCFRHDTDDSTTNANEEVLRDLILPELEKYGLTIEDPCIEHDCISGYLVLKP